MLHNYSELRLVKPKCVIKLENLWKLILLTNVTDLFLMYDFIILVKDLFFVIGLLWLENSRKSVSPHFKRERGAS